jgi:hypothetical protein
LSFTPGLPEHLLPSTGRAHGRYPAGLAKSLQPDYIPVMTNEEKRLITKHADQVFHGQTIRQNIPVCDCGKIYDEKGLQDAPGVFFTDIEVFGRTFTLIEPVCPRCNRKIAASFNILN